MRRIRIYNSEAITAYETFLPLNCVPSNVWEISKKVGKNLRLENVVFEFRSMIKTIKV